MDQHETNIRSGYNAFDLCNDLKNPDNIAALQMLANTEARKIFAT